MDVFSQYFKPVPSNPHYYFYCPLSSKKDVSPQLMLSVTQLIPDLDKSLIHPCLVRTTQKTVRYPGDGLRTC